MWLVCNRFFKAELKANKSEELVDPSPMVPASPLTANVISSAVIEVGGQTYHKPLIDLDIEHFYIQSSTPGHAHLYVDVLLPEDKYRKLLEVLVECDILGKGSAAQLDRDGGTILRLPGVSKYDEGNK